MKLRGEGMDAGDVREVDRYVRKIARLRGIEPGKLAALMKHHAGAR